VEYLVISLIRQLQSWFNTSSTTSLFFRPPTTHSREQFELPYDENKLTLHNLKDDTKYTVTVRAKNHRTYGVPRSITVWTSKGYRATSEYICSGR